MTTSAADFAAEEPRRQPPAESPAAQGKSPAASPRSAIEAAARAGRIGKSDASDSDLSKSGASDSDARESDASKSDPGREGLGKGDAGKGDTGSDPAGKGDAGRNDAGRDDAGRDDAGKGDRGEEKPRRARGEQTRQLILETALRLFRERGYTETTMRAIAKEAGVAVGNAYYYFDSKEHLIQGFYDRIQGAHRAAAEVVLADQKDFAGRLRGVLHAGIDVNQPYHSFAATFFKTAAEPSSPLSPFSRESSPAREAAIAIFRDVVEGSTAKLDPELRRELPELLWLGWMGVVLFWVHDRSPGQRRTRRLIDGVVPLVDRLVGLSRLRVLRPALRQILTLIDTIRRDD